MEPDLPSSTPRKVKFAPKVPRRSAKSATNKIETAAKDDRSDDEAEQQALLRRVEGLTRRAQKVEKKSSVQVVFSHGAASPAIRTFGKQKERTNDGSEAAPSKESSLDNVKSNFTPPLTARTEVGETSADSTDALIVKKKREYKEPWDYQHSYYPITLPLRRPYSGDPELLDEAEFEKDVGYDETTLCSARVLGLLDQVDSPSLLLFQLPANLPLDTKSFGGKCSETAEPKDVAGSISQFSGISTRTSGKGMTGSSTCPRSEEYDSRKEFSLEELLEGYMGKMLVYRSGTVKLKLGGVLYDVSPGSDCVFVQNVVSINTIDRHCCELGALTKRAVVSPDIDSLVDNVIDLG